ncbi:MAG: DNA mismatch repair protein MutS [Chitinophagaceae bacterium]
MAKIKTAETPLMQQHKTIKAKYPDAILLFRVGDFYETFQEDAIIASRILGIVLTKRANGSASFVELAGFPYHSLENYLHKLVKAGYRVAVCDQLEDPKLVKGIVKRGVTEMVTPGVALNEKLLENNRNNFLAALHFCGPLVGIAFLDISTGEFFLAEGGVEYIDKLLQSLRPAEVLFQKTKQKDFHALFGTSFYTYPLDEWIFSSTYSKETLLKHFHTHSLKGFGVEQMEAGIIAAGAILHYLKETEHTRLQHITGLQRMDQEDFLWMDKFTVRNLELLSGNGEKDFSLLRTLDQTVSPMGGRLLRRWVLFPLKDREAITKRLDLVEYFIKNPDLFHSCILHLKQTGDLERLVSRVPLRRITPREVLQLGRGLEQIQELKKILDRASQPDLLALSSSLDPCPLIEECIRSTLVDNPPMLVSKGGIIRPGVLAELDELHLIASSGKDFLLEIQQKESQNTGIPSLKISFNSVFGYYLEVTNTHKNKVPAGWIRKQTLANAERYITPELKEYEEKITGAEEKIIALEARIYEDLLLQVQPYLPAIQINGQMLGKLDVLLCFARNALDFLYHRPVIEEGTDLKIMEGRHPVIERLLPAGSEYVSNDTELNQHDQQIIILTGPNMSGKSALLRQTGLITLMAHMGSFVPARSAQIGLTDKIFCRVGASDNLSGGESTFMVEMNETASIINNITPRSLILLDEIGRGTSTYDGISIAWSIVEYLHHMTPHRPKTLFATHYHELNEMEHQFSRVRNFHITHQESGNKVIFLRKLVPGGSRHSFGIQVASMAGMPQALIDKANEILVLLEKKNREEAPQHALKKVVTRHYQLDIFDAHSTTFQQIRELLEKTDLDHLTPIEALLRLNEIKALLK